MTTRITPYEVILGSLESTVFPAIQIEGEQRGVDVRRRDQFVLLGHVGAVLREIVSDEAPPESLEEYSELLYHGFQFWVSGRRLYAFDEDVTAVLTSRSYDFGGWELAAPPACYLQFPNQRLWARVAADAPWEPVDGCTVVVDETEAAPDSGAHMRVQVSLGFRLDRPGLSLISYRTDLEPTQAATFGELPWREDGDAFASTIPGGDRSGLRTLATTSELQALVLRALHWLDRRHATLSPAPAGTAQDETKLPHTLVSSS